MVKPQQPELARSSRGSTDPASAKAVVSEPLAEGGPTGPVPEGNQPGHHPQVDQDKPTRPPPSRRRTPAGARGRPSARRPSARHAGRQPGADDARRFSFTFDPWRAPFTAAAGVTPWTASVSVARGRLHVRYGPWSLSTEVANVAEAELTGAPPWWLTGGPPRVGLGGEATFASATTPGVRIAFSEPVPAVFPFALIRHKAVTVTVDDPEALAETLTTARPG